MTEAKRLWLRNLNDTWVPLPQGADNDRDYGTKKPIRSVNYWDAYNKRWLNPFPWQQPDWLWYADRNTASLKIYEYNVRWGFDVPYNPNSWNPPDPGTFSSWVQLTGLRPRNDPNSKILTWTKPVPQPLRTPAYPYDLTSQGYRDDMMPSPEIRGVTINGDPGRDWDAFVFYNLLPERPDHPFVLSPYFGDLCQARAIADDVNLPGAVRTWNMSTLFDLAVWRRFQEDVYPRSMYYTGQYKPLSDMKLKRIVIRGAIHYRCMFGALQPTPIKIDEVKYYNFWDEFAWSLNYQKPAMGTPVDVSLDSNPLTRHYGHRKPVGVFIADTTHLDVQLTLPATTTELFSGTFYREYEKPFSFTIEDPGEDSIAFDFSLQMPGPLAKDNYPEIPAYNLYPSIIASNVRAWFAQVDFHYAVGGHDTPADTHHFPAVYT